MKVIFIDIDGVLNSPHDNSEYLSDMNVDKLVLLKSLLIELNYDGVIITSDRRYSSIDMDDKLDAFDSYDIHVLGQIRNPYLDIEDSRGQQILDYIKDNNVEEFIILDDNDDNVSIIFKDKFFKINRFDGLDEKNWTNIIKQMK